jgi:hypothetical protein
MNMSESAKASMDSPSKVDQATEEAPPMMSGKQPSPYTMMRQKSTSKTEQRNYDDEYTRQEFYALINRAVNTPATQLGSARKRTSVR